MLPGEIDPLVFKFNLMAFYAKNSREFKRPILRTVIWEWKHYSYEKVIKVRCDLEELNIKGRKISDEK